MDKNEILEKSRREYQREMSDEREKQVQLNALQHGSKVSFVVLLLLHIFHGVRGIPSYDLEILFWSAQAAGLLYLILKKEKGNLVPLLASLAFLAYNLVKFFTQG